jgi:nucleotide-binding universal stress UspA family protein
MKSLVMNTTFEREKSSMLKKIIAALDTSVMSKHVFDSALALAKMTDANLTLLYVFAEEDEGLAYPKLETLEQYPGVTGEAFKCYTGHLNLEHLNAVDNPGLHLLQSRTHQATATGVDVEFFQCFGKPGPTICQFAQSLGADLIVIGHRGRSGLTELLLGSVSNYVVHHALCSVHIVHPPVQAQTSDTFTSV